MSPLSRWMKQSFRDEPADHKGIDPKELDYIIANRQEAGKRKVEPTPLTAMELFTSGNLWLMMGQYFASNFTFFFTLSWLYPYIKRTYSLDYTEAGFYTMIPLLAGALGNLTSGTLVDRLFRYGHRAFSRRLPAILGFGFATIGLLMSVDQASVIGAVVWLSIGVFGADMTLSPSWSFCIDIGGRHAGAVSGTMNMAGNLGSAVVGILFPYLIAWTGGPTTFFYVAAALNATAILCWLFVRPENRLASA